MSRIGKVYYGLQLSGRIGETEFNTRTQNNLFATQEEAKQYVKELKKEADGDLDDCVPVIWEMKRVL